MLNRRSVLDWANGCLATLCAMGAAAIACLVVIFALCNMNVPVWGIYATMGVFAVALILIVVDIWSNC